MRFMKSDINLTKLPSNRDVIEYLLFLQYEGTASLAKRRRLSYYIKGVITPLQELWQRTNIPIVSKSTIRRKITNILKKYNDVIKHSRKYEANEWDKILMLSQCKCDVVLKKKCNCPATQRIPLNSMKLYIDQCGSRLLTLDSQLEEVDDVQMVDEIGSCELQSAVVNCIYQRSTTTAQYNPSSSEEEEFQENQREILPDMETGLKVADIRLANFCAALDRSGTSNRFGSLLATMLIKDLKTALSAKAKSDVPQEKIAEKMIKYLDDIIIDKNKIQRERAKLRADAKAASQSQKLLKCISFDGKKERTLKKKVILNETRLMRVSEEHVTILKEPGSKFIGYTTPMMGTGEEIQKSIVNFLVRENYHLDHLVAISCDGTVVNTGHKNGVISFMERYLQRPLQWLVCLFHFNELPLNALLKKLFGKQKGPGIWPGEFGIEISNCEKYAVAQDFVPIAMGCMPENIDSWDIRHDQRYLYRMVLAVNRGDCDERLAREKPGPVSSARWLTTAARILRLYITKRQPSLIIQTLAQFIVKVYAPFWFLVKSQPLAIHGSRHVFQYISWIRQLPMDVQLAIRPTIANNAFFFHPENILLSMITDPDQLKRFEAYEKIVNARLEPPTTIRTFRVPHQEVIKFDSDSYTQMIDWDQVTITEPPTIQFFLQEELNEYKFSDEIINIPEFLCHSQNTERFVHVVSQSAIAVSDEQRLGHIYAKLDSRERYSRLDSRQDLN